jgi:tetratricopeptide (TPR) repeat protein
VALPRQQTLFATLDWSYALLSERERRVFDRLSVFVGGFTLELAHAVCSGGNIDEADVFDVLSSLVDKSLVVADRSAERTRYRLLESLREYANQNLTRRGEQQLIARRHAEACVALAEGIEASLSPGSEPVDRDQIRNMRGEHGNWNAALAWCLGARNDIALGQRLAAVVCRPLYVNLSAPLLPWLGVALDAVDVNTPRAVVAKLALRSAKWQGYLEHLGAALDAANRAIAIYAELDEPLWLAEARRFAAHELGWLGRCDEAQELIEQVLADLRQLGNDSALKRALVTAVSVSGDCGNLSSARSFYAEAMRMFDQTDGYPPVLLAALKDVMASAEGDAGGDIETALRYDRESLEIFRNLDHPGMWAGHKMHASFLIALERFDEAREHALRFLEYGWETQADIAIALAIFHLAAIAALRERAGAEDLHDDRTRAARLLGFFDRRAAEVPDVRAGWLGRLPEREHARAEEALHEALGADEVAHLMSDGAAMTLEQAAEMARTI